MTLLPTHAFAAKSTTQIVSLRTHAQTSEKSSCGITAEVTTMAACSVCLANKCRANSVAHATTMNASTELSLAQRWQ
jgi:hypothetical protein